MSRRHLALPSFRNRVPASGRRSTSPGPLTRPTGASQPLGVLMAEIAKPCGSTLQLRREMRWEYRLIFFSAFVYFLVVATASRLLPRSWRPHLPGIEPRQSVFGEAWAVAGTLVPFAFTR